MDTLSLSHGILRMHISYNAWLMVFIVLPEVNKLRLRLRLQQNRSKLRLRLRPSGSGAQHYRKLKQSISKEINCGEHRYMNIRPLSYWFCYATGKVIFYTCMMWCTAIDFSFLLWPCSVSHVKCTSVYIQLHTPSHQSHSYIQDSKE